MKHWLIIALLASVALAGCASEEPEETPIVVPEPEPQPDPIFEEEVALAKSLLLTTPEKIMDGPLQTFGTAIAAYGNGTRLAIAGIKGGDYHVRISDDAGNSWGPEIQATNGAGAGTNSAEPPSIAFGGPDEIHLSFTTSSGVSYVVSRDGGATFSAPAVLDGQNGNALDAFTAMDANEAGRVAVIWLRGSIEGGTGASETVRSYQGIISEDGGNTWGDVTTFPGQNEPCDCCGAAVAVRDDGTVFGLWRNIYEPGPDQSRDYTLSVNVPGQGWSEGQRLDPSHWQYNGCPASASAMNVAPDGTVTATWWTGAAAKPGYILGQVAPGETNMVTKQALQFDAPASASSSATDGEGFAWALWADESTNPTTLRLAREQNGAYETLGAFEGYDWPRMAGTPDGFVAIFMDGNDDMYLLRGSTPLSPAIIDIESTRGFAPFTIAGELKAAGGITGEWTFEDGRNAPVTGTELPYAFETTFESYGSYQMRFSIGGHETVVPIQVDRFLELPAEHIFTAGPLMSCSLAGCLAEEAGPQPAPGIDGFWTEVDEKYWGLVAASDGDLVNPTGVGTGIVKFYQDGTLLGQNEANAGAIVPDGTTHVFTHGTSNVFGSPVNVYEEMRLVFSLPGGT